MHLHSSPVRTRNKNMFLQVLSKQENCLCNKSMQLSIKDKVPSVQSYNAGDSSSNSIAPINIMTATKLRIIVLPRYFN